MFILPAGSRVIRLEIDCSKEYIAVTFRGLSQPTIDKILPIFAEYSSENLEIYVLVSFDFEEGIG